MGWFDKGVLGGAQGDNGTMGGLLAGAKPSGWDIASMIASGLQDANAGYRGQPGGNLDTTMQDMQTHHMHRALMEGLQSPDPTIRQKAYSAAAMLGIDTKPIQQQQATSQLPAFLASMKPQDLTMGSNSAPLNNGSTITTPPINFQSPGKSISEAIGSAPPELQGMYAPKMLDQQITAEAEANKPYTIGDGQHRFVGSQEIAGLPEKATPNAAFNPDGTPNLPFQAYQAQLEKVRQGPAWANYALAKSKADPNLGGPTQSLADASPQVQSMVKAMLEGRQQPPSSFALSKPYWQNMLALANQADPTFDQTAWGARASARKDMTGGGKSYQLLNSGNTAIQHLGRLHDQIGDVSGVQVPLVGNLVNSGVNAVSQASGVPGVNAYNDTLGHLSEETTKFYRGTGGNEADVARNMASLSPNLSTDQKKAGIANTVHLLFGALQPKVEQYNKTMGTNFPVSHFLSQKSVQTIQKMGFDPDSGEAIAAPTSTGWSIKKVP